MKEPKIVFVEDYLLKYGGEQKVLEEMVHVFPNSPIFTSVYNEKAFKLGVLESTDIRCNKNPLFKKFIKIFTVFMPLIFEGMDLREYDIVLSNGTAWAKGVLTRPDQLHISYINTPPRFLYGYSVESSKRDKWYFKPVVPYLDAVLRVWDYSAAQRPNYILVNSKEVQKRVKKFYGRESTVIYPPVEIGWKNLKKPDIQIKTPYFLTIGRMSAYKNFGVVVKAFNKLNANLIMIGTGLEEKKLKKIAGPTVTFAGECSHEEKHYLIENALGLINSVDNEDFGIVPMEAMSHGKPVLAHKSGGHLETMLEGKTGMFFDTLNPEDLAQKIKEFDQNIKKGIYEPEEIKKHVEKFSSQRFRQEFKNFVMEKWNARTT